MSKKYFIYFFYFKIYNLNVQEAGSVGWCYSEEMGQLSAKPDCLLWAKYFEKTRLLIAIIPIYNVI